MCEVRPFARPTRTGWVPVKTDINRLAAPCRVPRHRDIHYVCCIGDGGPRANCGKDVSDRKLASKDAPVTCARCADSERTSRARPSTRACGHSRPCRSSPEGRRRLYSTRSEYLGDEAHGTAQPTG